MTTISRPASAGRSQLRRRKSEIVAILGTNGTSKTTLFKCINCILAPAAKADEICQALLGQSDCAQMAAAFGGIGKLTFSDQ